ncbi:MAG: hypothetical protein MRJ65_12000 [Candidatus Brocadiaceae bacterium]|nr:hypothetical protein [Candidatus Brocadiaceae bacterium]
MIEDFPFRIQLSTVFPFLPVVGDSLRDATTGPLTSAATIGQHDAIPEDAKHPRDQNRSHQFAEIATQFRVRYKAQDIFSSNVNDQVAVQMALAVRELLYKFWTLFESGDSLANPDEFDGLLRIVDPTKVVDLGCRELTLEDMDRTKELVRTSDGRGVVIFTSSISKRAIHGDYWDRGVNPEYEEMEFSRPDGGSTMQQALKFDGAPVYINDLNQVFECKGNKPGKQIPSGKMLNLDGFEPPVATNLWFFVLGTGTCTGLCRRRRKASLRVRRS